MATKESTTQTIELLDIGEQLSSLGETIGRGGRRILIERSGGPVAALDSSDDLAR